MVFEATSGQQWPGTNFGGGGQAYERATQNVASPLRPVNSSASDPIGLAVTRGLERHHLLRIRR